jgi:hypothetical protein
MIIRRDAAIVEPSALAKTGEERERPEPAADSDNE